LDIAYRTHYRVKGSRALCATLELVLLGTVVSAGRPYLEAVRPPDKHHDDVRHLF